MDVCWSVGMSVKKTQQLASWAIIGDLAFQLATSPHNAFRERLPDRGLDGCSRKKSVPRHQLRTSLASCAQPGYHLAAHTTLRISQLPFTGSELRALTVRRGLPSFHSRTCKWLPRLRARQLSIQIHHSGVLRRVESNRAAVLSSGGIRSPEGTQNSCSCARNTLLCQLSMCDVVHETTIRMRH